MTRPATIGSFHADAERARGTQEGTHASAGRRPRGKRIYVRCPWCGRLNSPHDAECTHCHRVARSA